MSESKPLWKGWAVVQLFGRNGPTTTRRYLGSTRSDAIANHDEQWAVPRLKYKNRKRRGEVRCQRVTLRGEQP